MKHKQISRTLNKPLFIISIDFELAWGFSSFSRSRILRALKEDPEYGRGSINFLIRTFEKYQLPATWAIVGHLFLNRCEKEDGKPHRTIPRISEDWYSRDPCTNIERDPLYYGKDSIEKILVSPVKHEIGYHSFSHVRFDLCSPAVAEGEIIEGLKLARELGITMNSFIFPKGKVGNLDTLIKNGFTAYRPTPITREAANQNFLRLNINRILDRVLTPPVVEPKWINGLWEIPASMDFYDVPLFQFLILPRAKLGILQAIKEKKAFHLTLHPDRFVAYPSLRDSLDKFLRFVSAKREQGLLEVTTMRGMIF